MQKSSNQIARSPVADLSLPLARPKTGTKLPSERLLGRTAKSVGRFSGGASKNTQQNKAKEARATRFRHQRFASKTLGQTARVGNCRWSVISKNNGVDVVTSEHADGAISAHFAGLQTCGSVWCCPCCGARISETRRDELNQLLAWARANGYEVSMMTLTFQHQREDDLADILGRMKVAKQRFAQHRSYKKLKPEIIGSVTATEVTGGGANGWHPHFHIIFVTLEGADLTGLRAVWLASLRGTGLDGGHAAFQIQDASAAGRYVGKWGAAEELTLSGKKSGRSGRTPQQLLAAGADDGDLRAAKLWREFATVFKGRRQLVWSRGLKNLAGIGVIDDAEAAKDAMQDEQIETGRSNIPHGAWRANVASRDADRRAEFSEIAEKDGADAAAQAAMMGPKIAEVEQPTHTPKAGGLAARALAMICQSPPP